MCAIFLFSSWHAPPFPFSFLPLHAFFFLCEFSIIFLMVLPSLYLLSAFFFSSFSLNPSCCFPSFNLRRQTWLLSPISSDRTHHHKHNLFSSSSDWTHNHKPKLFFPWSNPQSQTQLLIFFLWPNPLFSPWPNPKTHYWNPSAHLKTEDSREGIKLPFGSDWSSMGINNGLLGFGLG